MLVHDAEARFGKSCDTKHCRAAQLMMISVRQDRVMTWHYAVAVVLQTSLIPGVSISKKYKLIG